MSRAHPFSRWLGAIAILTTLALISPAVIARAAATAGLRVIPGAGRAGSSILVQGLGFPSGERVDVVFDSARVGTLRALRTGAFDLRVKIPNAATPGNHVIVATGRRHDTTAKAPFVVTLDWPQLGLDAAHDHFNPYESVLSPALVPQMQQLWQSQAPAEGIEASPAVVNGIVYIDSRDGTLYAYAATGCQSPPCAPLWTANVPGPPTNPANGGSVFTSPTVAKGILYLGGGDGMYAFRAMGCGAPVCRPIWKTGTVGSAGTATVSGGLLYFGADTNVYVLDASSGKLEWIAPQAYGFDFSFSPPTIVGGSLFVSGDANLRAYPAAGCGGASCAPLWSGETSYGHSTPAVSDGVVYVADEAGNLTAFNAAGCGSPTCTPLWSQHVATPLYDSPAVANGRVYVARNKLYAFDATNGTPLWATPTGGTSYSSPAVANGVVYVGMELGFWAVGAFDAVSGQQLATLPTSDPTDSSPAVVNGVVYAASTRLYAFGLPGAV